MKVTQLLLAQLILSMACILLTMSIGLGWGLWGIGIGLFGGAWWGAKHWQLPHRREQLKALAWQCGQPWGLLIAALWLLIGPGGIPWFSRLVIAGLIAVMGVVTTMGLTLIGLDLGSVKRRS